MRVRMEGTEELANKKNCKRYKKIQRTEGVKTLKVEVCVNGSVFVSVCECVITFDEKGKECEKCE